MEIIETATKMAVPIPDMPKFYSECTISTENGYLCFDLELKNRMIRFMSVRFIELIGVRANAGVCFKESMVCFEQAENGANLSALSADTNAQLVDVESDIPGGLMITASGKRCKPWTEDELYGENAQEYEKVVLRAIPYAFWGNRDNGEMQVWIRESRSL